MGNLLSFLLIFGGLYSLLPNRLMAPLYRAIGYALLRRVLLAIPTCTLWERDHALYGYRLRGTRLMIGDQTIFAASVDLELSRILPMVRTRSPAFLRVMGLRHG